LTNSIDLNCDMGESYGAYKLGSDDEIIKLVSSVNIACGYHGGDPDVMDHTVAMAKKFQIGVGAHPGFPNLLGFGRWNMDVPKKSLMNMIIYQIGALQIFCQKHGVEIQHVKPHGSLNNMADTNAEIASSIVEAIISINPNLPLYVKPNSELEKIAKKHGLPVVLELFADRAYNDDLSLVSRSREGSVITDLDEVIDRVVNMVKKKKVTTITGKEININGQSICVHGDTPSALHMVRAITKALKEIGVTINPPSLSSMKS